MASPANPRPPPIQGLLIDISGTLLIGSSPTPGAAQALAKLRAAHIPFRFCSNTSKESSDAVHERMCAAGLDVRREEVWTSIGSLRVMLKELRVKRPYLLLSRSALEECTAGSGMEDISLTDSLPHDAVVIGLAPPLLDYAHLNTAFRILVGENRSQDTSAPQARQETRSSSSTNGTQAQPPLIALHKARYLEAPDHALSLGLGPFVHALEHAARTSAVVVGKPTRSFFEVVLRDLEYDLNSAQREGDDVFGLPHASQFSPSHSPRWPGTAVIGDDVDADLGEGAIELGLWRVLVKTGKYRPGDERRTHGLPPDQVSQSFSVFVDGLLDQQRMSF